MRRILSIVLAMCIMLSVCAVPTLAEGMPMAQMQAKDAIAIMVDGTYVDCMAYGQMPVIVEGRTLVPLRSVFEALGATVEWNGELRSVTSVKGNVTVSLAVDSKDMTVNGTVKTLDVPACIMNSRTMVPVRAVAEAFGCKVEWDNNTRTVIITTVKEEKPLDYAAAEQVVLDMWAALTAGEFEKVRSYCAEGVEIEGLTDIEAVMGESLWGEELDFSAFTPAQREKLEAATAKVVDTFLKSMVLTVDATEAVSETEVIVHITLSSPDFEALDTTSLVNEQLMMVLMLKVMEEQGISLEELEYLTEEAEAELTIEVTIKMIEYLSGAIETSVKMLPKAEDEKLDVRLKVTDGKWLIVE